MATYWGYDHNRTPNYGRWIDEPVPGRYDARDFVNRYGPLTSSTHGQSPWRGLTTPTANAEFRPGSISSRLGMLGRLGLGMGSLGAGLMTRSADAGRGSDIPGIRGPGGQPAWGAQHGASMDYIQAEDDLLNDANRGNNPYMGSATPMSTSSSVAPVGSFLSADSTPSSVGQYGWGSYTPSTDYPAVPESLVHSNIEANRRGEMVDPTWSGPFAPFAGGSFLRGLTGADAIDFGTAVTGATQASPGAEYAANLASIGLSPTRPGGHGTQHPGRGSEIDAALAATGHVMSPGQFAQQYFDKTDTEVTRGLSNIMSGLRSKLGRTNTQQTLDAYKSALDDVRGAFAAKNAAAAAARGATEVATGVDQFGEVANVLANPDINVANTIQASLSRAEDAIAGMGLTGAAAQKASDLVSAELGYLSASQLAGLAAAQQEQDRAAAAAAQAAYEASRSSQGSSDDNESDPDDTMAGFGTVSNEAIAGMMAEIAEARGRAAAEDKANQDIMAALDAMRGGGWSGGDDAGMGDYGGSDTGGGGGFGYGI